ncbi:hypothetical protein PPACK8108_LOCUS9968 [Phakopsora pachyrhizi]|uniref:Uncharacterized protein n=1 Tax=Phakopsora pachyrhizi TaxID=170000 RepID=A0AAV0B057_PHAPC|nr:hypothetical protein PPACK8108_LOCUS9968 [Phakopsora pachyrhizi]
MSCIAKLCGCFTGGKDSNSENPRPSRSVGPNETLEFIRIPWDGSIPTIVRARTVQAPNAPRLVPDLRNFYHRSTDAWHSINFQMIRMLHPKVKECEGNYLAIYTLVQENHGFSRNISTDREVYGDIFLVKISSDNAKKLEHVSVELLGQLMLPALTNAVRIIGPEMNPLNSWPVNVSADFTPL